MGDNEWLSTLYGAHKFCGEQMASVYLHDWKVPSVGIRPAIVYGPGRDQGMSAAPTVAMLAAFAGEEYNVPFSGPVSFVHVEDAAARFVAAVAKPIEGAFVFDLNGTAETVAAVINQITEQFHDSSVSFSGAPLPFPAHEDDGRLDEFLEISPCRPMTKGIRDTFTVFEKAQDRGVDIVALAKSIIGKN